MAFPSSAAATPPTHFAAARSRPGELRELVPDVTKTLVIGWQGGCHTPSFC